jgi:hypothetical protein
MQCDAAAVLALIAKGDEHDRHRQDDQRKRVKQNCEDSPAFHGF